MRTRLAFASLFGLAAFVLVPPVGAAVKDQSRLPMEKQKKPTPPKMVPDLKGDDTPVEPPGDTPDGPRDDSQHDDFNVEDIPPVVTVKLTVDIAKRALDAFAEVGSKYDDKGLNDYPTLKEFVDKTEAGKQLEADVKKHGFSDITDWNNAISNVTFAFGALYSDPTEEIRQQIAEVKANKKLSDDQKQRVIASLNAMIPSDQNKEIIRKVMKLPGYEAKLNLLHAFE